MTVQCEREYFSITCLETASFLDLKHYVDMNEVQVQVQVQVQLTQLERRDLEGGYGIVVVRVLLLVHTTY
jgi:hypothetical protein